MATSDAILPTQLAGAAPRRSAERFGLPEVYALIALASFAVARFVPVLDIHYPCPFLTLTGIPCATCGMTHAFVYVAHGRVADALRWSPLGAGLAATAWAFAVADVVRVIAGWRLPRLPAAIARRASLAGFGLLLANWAFLILHGLGP